MVSTDPKISNPPLSPHEMGEAMQESVRELLKQVGLGKMSDAAYDTAWIARLDEIDWELSNRALAWLSEHQLGDGSWGTEQPFYYHDRLISTLAAMIALTYRGRRAQDRVQIEQGLLALEAITNNATRQLQSHTNGATVGFEMIVPTLVVEAEGLGIIKRQGERILGKLKHLRDAKMAKLAGHRISRFISAAHSAEMTGKDKIDLLDVDHLQENNGSVGNSPSATAHYALFVKPGDESALDYLRSLMNAGNGGVPTLSPVEIFERIWVLWNLSLTNLFESDNEIRNLCLPHLDYIEEHWRPRQGLGFSRSFSVTDSDDTSVGFEMLSKFGRKPELEAVLNYEEENWFRCFELEANPSVDVNVHVLGALRQAGYERSQPSIKKIIKFIRAMRQPAGYWFDKWNVSPYYTTSHISILCRGYDDEICQDSANWILNTQNADGSWGFYGFSTAEETAYCIQALKIWQRHGGKGLQGNIEKAGNWLSKNCSLPYPPLWIDKSLYRPEAIVRSTILSALILAEE